jgi:hypothetical protein
MSRTRSIHTEGLCDSHFIMNVALIIDISRIFYHIHYKNINL